MQVLLLSDIQNDFLAGGALAVPHGDQVVEVANGAMVNAKHVVAIQDWHPPGHGSFASQHPGIEVGDTFLLNGLSQIAWPDHCVQGTHGAEFAKTLRQDRIEFVARKGTRREIDSYSGFFDNAHLHATGLHDYLKSIGATELTVLGLATDYCVKFTVLDAIQLGYSIRVLLAGCRGVNLHPGDVDAAIEVMRQAGAEIVD